LAARLQTARIPADDLLSEVYVAPFPIRRAVNVKDSLRRCIDDSRDFQPLNAVSDSLAVVAARW